jgi:hypothetical protein
LIADHRRFLIMRKLIAAAVPAVLAAALAVPALGSTPSRTVKIGDDFQRR